MPHEAEIIDFWDRDRNSIIIDDSFAKERVEHNRPTIPILHGAVGPQPTIQDESDKPALDSRGHSVFHSAIHTFEPFNKFTSQLMDIQKKTTSGSLIHKSKTGQKKLTGDPYASYMEIQLEEGEEVSPLELPKVPEITMALLGILDTEKQQAMLPYPLAYGGTRDPLSGRALAQLTDATKSVYSPRTGAMSRCYSWLAEQLLGQFAEKGTTTNFRGYDPAGRYFSLKIQPRQVKKGWYIAVKVEPKLPRDLEQDVQTARMATEPIGPNGEPIMSRQTAREDIIQMRDPDAERDRVLAELGEALPPIVIQNVAAALSRRGDTDTAQQVLALNQPAPTAPTAAAAPTAGGPGPTITREQIQQIAQLFIQAGQQELGVAVLELLGVQVPPPGGPAANGTTPAPVPAPVA